MWNPSYSGLLMTVLLIGYGCSDTSTSNREYSRPEVVTDEVTEIEDTTATGNGILTATGGRITEVGFCWSVDSLPTVDDFSAEGSFAQRAKDLEEASLTHIGSHLSFTADITGLSPDTEYHVRAFARNREGLSYGEDMTFTTTRDSVGLK